MILILIKNNYLVTSKFCFLNHVQKVLVQPKLLLRTSPKHLGPNQNYPIEGEDIICLTLRNRIKMAAERLKGPKQLSRYKKRRKWRLLLLLYCKLRFFFLENASVILPILLLYCKLRFFFLKMHRLFCPQKTLYIYILEQYTLCFSNF